MRARVRVRAGARVPSSRVRAGARRAGELGAIRAPLAVDPSAVTLGYAARRAVEAAQYSVGAAEQAHPENGGVGGDGLVQAGEQPLDRLPH